MMSLSLTSPRQLPGPTRQPWRRHDRLIRGLLCVSLWTAGPGFAQNPVDDLMTLSLEDLMGVEVSLAARSEQPLSETAAAIHIVTRDDIRRSGATSIAALLRQVPGVHVARIDANKWAVTSRGFSGRFANKLLVQVDGRTVYAPAFSGVYWEELDVVLADIERIEVIRGPGAALWGANAVNGVINIVMQSAAETHGTLVQALGGDEDRAHVSVRHGGRFSDTGDYRLYAKVTDRDAALDTLRQDAGDAWSSARAGGRLDWRLPGAALYLEAEASFGEMTNRVRLPRLDATSFATTKDPIDVVGGHVLSRWETIDDPDNHWATQWFYNLQDRDEFSRQRVQTLDLDLQNLRRRGRHELIWGGGFRVTWDHLSSSLAIDIEEPKTTTRHYGFFVQDDIAMDGDRLHLILGTKLEHNGFTGVEIQPTARLRYTPHHRLTMWTALSRAVRTPSRGERGVRVVLPGTQLPPAVLPEGAVAGFLALTGGPDFDAERVHAVEVGARGLVKSWLLLDVALFRHDYDDLLALKSGSVFLDSTWGQPVLFLPARFTNLMHGRSMGAEVMADLRVAESTRFTAQYSFIDIDLMDPTGTSAALEEKGTPRHQLRLAASHDIGEHLTLDGAWRYVDELSFLNVDAYSELDLRLGVQLRDGVDFELSVSNALSAEHQEYQPRSLHSDPALIERSLHAGVVWRR